jgi:hypothetical protein
MPNHIILIHGYSDTGKAMDSWKANLAKAFPERSIHVVSYKTLTNDINIMDIAEAFERAFKNKLNIPDGDAFDALVHSTGMLVMRAWLLMFPNRQRQLKRLIGLAPATFGSPLAHEGRSLLGQVIKGNWTGPDFLEAGNQVLDDLELASSFTWDLAHKDLLGNQAIYGPGPDSPYVFVICGTKQYGGIRKLVNAPGTDGTVRFAGCALNTRKINIDLSRRTDNGNGTPPLQAGRPPIEPWSNVSIPVHLVPDQNHATILEEPTDLVVRYVQSALNVASEGEYTTWNERFRAELDSHSKNLTRYQQFIVRSFDERGDTLASYAVNLIAEDANGKTIENLEFDDACHVYEGDNSLRCFHVDVGPIIDAKPNKLFLELTTEVWSDLVGYFGYQNAGAAVTPINVSSTRKKVRTVKIDISKYLNLNGFSIFYPFTTTLVELRLDREPLPLAGVSDICS